MKTSEILRQLADIIDTIDSDNKTKTNKESDLAQQPDDLYIPPLQLKLELLKKATNVENVYDEDLENTKPHSYDELTAIKKNAGINVTALDELVDDEPLEN